MILFSRNFVNIEDQHSPLGMEPQQWLEDAEFITFQARIMAKSKRDRMESQGGKAMSPPPLKVSRGARQILPLYCPIFSSIFPVLIQHQQPYGMTNADIYELSEG